jgi:hypothetical protein
VTEPKIGKVRIHLDVRIVDVEACRRRVEILGGRGPASSTTATPPGSSPV